MYMEQTGRNKPLTKQLADVHQWCAERGINQVYAFFKGCDPSIAAHEARIRFVMRNPHAPELVDTDGLWLGSMKATMTALAKRKLTAA